MAAPLILRLSEFTIMRTYLPNLDELSFLTVLAFPNDSNIGLQAIIFSSILKKSTLNGQITFHYQLPHFLIR